jgi:hypothetical protein
MRFICSCTLFVCLSLTWTGGALAESGRQCLSYEPTVVKLAGTIISKIYPGPPEYESIRKGDEPETYWLLVLPQPACVTRDDTQRYSYSSQEGVRQIQLVFKDEGMYKTYRSLLGKHVLATGTLFGANTIHHKTPVLLWVQNLARAR